LRGDVDSYISSILSDFRFSLLKSLFLTNENSLTIISNILCNSKLCAVINNGDFLCT